VSVLPDNGKIPLLVLVGPTAVGKSKLALKISHFLNTDIISADSAQVYRRLDIGTAKPNPEEQLAVKHHLINIIDPDKFYSAADYQRDADKVIGQIWRQGKLPFMVGGTGLYIKAVTDRYAFGPKGASRELRSAYEHLARTEGLDKLYARLKAVDPDAAEKIHHNDQKRIIRALEVYTLEGKPISTQVSSTYPHESPYRTVIFGLTMERDMLYRRIENRVDKMLEQGFLDEVHSLYKEGYDDDAPGMQVLGYRQLLAYLKKYMSWEETIIEIKKQTRNLAKRQLTWFRRENIFEWFKITEQSLLDNITENIYSKVKDITP
jgi:tRNA dimethylallyltransferase